MSEYFNEGQRQLQENFETVPLADRLQAGIIAAEINPLDAEFIEAQNMFFLATVDDNGQVGLLFVDFNKQARVRVNGLASITENDPLLSHWPEAVLVIRVAVRETFPNCPRYIHKMALVEESTFVPKAQCKTPDAPWKKLEIVADVLPPKDAHLASNEQDVLAAINRN